MLGDAPQTPMMAQYRRIKGELPRDALLLFRLGDFYEMFFEDAHIGARILGLALTRRNGVPMCGLPYHAASAYVGKLLRAGYKVALCDQLEEAKPGKLVKRAVTAILSPGTHWDERLLPQEQNNFLASVYPASDGFGLAVIDLSTGEFRTTELADPAALRTELERLRPAEILYPSENHSLRSVLLDATDHPDSSDSTPAAPVPPTPRPAGRHGWVLTPYEDWVFLPDTARHTLCEHFRVATLDGFGLKGRSRAIGAAGAALHYLGQHLRRDLRHLTRLSYYHRADYLVLDSTTLRHLEVLEPLQRDAPSSASLYGAVNRTVTPMGARRLRDWLSQPLARREPIIRRQEAIQAFLDHPGTLEEFRRHLTDVRDLERILSRLSSGSGNARDLVALRLALEQLPTLRRLLESLTPVPSAETDLPQFAEPTAAVTPPVLITELATQLPPFPELVELLRRAIVDDPPLSTKEGGMIRDGFDPALDELRHAMREGKDWIARYQAQEIQRTGIPSLKVRYNSVFGYYIEVTRANLDRVPPHYQRKQTIANGERFITPELKEIEAKILGAEERSLRLEYELFQQVREQVLAQLVALQQAAHALAWADVLAALAETARIYQYCRPVVQDEGLLEIHDGRHPVLEQTLLDQRFVPNDTWLASGPALATLDLPSAPQPQGTTAEESRPPQIALITGPNMAGKSTYIRQVALIVLLAHVGSFVPARSARIDLIDRLFTRIGAADDLARGQSTFMVEMTETANILNHATTRSLIILDEVGRGTSTFDGLSLAWSIVEYIHNQIGAKTLFATHYHELTELAARLPRLKNYNVAVREWRDQIVFLHKIVKGATDKSYGLHVARLAGVPQAVLERAKIILANLEAAELNPEGTPKSPERPRRERTKLRQVPPSAQLDLFA